MIPPIVVNLLGGPGCGKSTITAGVFSELKWHGVNCELALEFAKDKVWEESLKVLDDQVYILGKQHHRLYRLADQVDVIVTDSPLLLSLIYGEHWGDTLAKLALSLMDRYYNMNYVLERVKPYNPKGRVQTEEKARLLDDRIRQVLEYNQLQYTILPGTKTSQEVITRDVLRRLHHDL